MSVFCVCLLIDQKFCHKIVKVANVMTKSDSLSITTQTHTTEVHMFFFIIRRGINSKLRCLYAYCQWKLANDCARISAVIIYKKHLEFVFLLSFLIFFFLLGKSLGTFSHHPLSFLSCFKDFLADLWIMSEYFVEVLFGQHKDIRICLCPCNEVMKKRYRYKKKRRTL